MHIKHLNTGTGSARSAKEYLLQDHDHKGELRESVQVLRGNPELVTQLADSLDFKHKYSSAVLAWHKDDKPTMEQIEEAVSEYHRVAFAGLDPHQYASYAVLHDQDHVHIVTARVELSTRKSFNPAPPGHEKTYDLIRDKLNEKHDWAKPNDLTRKRLVNDSLNIHADLKANEAKKMVNDTVTELVNAGKLTNRAEVVQYLGQFGEITREGKDYISLKPNGFKKAFKLKGAVYEQGYELNSLVAEVGREQEARVGRNQEDRDREVKRIERVIEEVVRDRAEYVGKRYDRTAQDLSQEVVTDQSQDLQGRGRGLEADRGRSLDSVRDVEQSESPLLDNTSDSRLDPFNRTSDRTMGVRGSDHRPQPNPPSPERGSSQREKAEGSSERSRRDREAVRRRDRGQETAQSVPVGERELRGSVEVDYDTVRARVEARVRASKRTIQPRVKERHSELREELRQRKQSVSEDHRRSAEHHQTAEPNLDPVRADIDRSKGELRSRAVTELEAVERATGRIGTVRQGLSGAVKQVIEKAIVKIKEIAKKAERAYSQSWGMSR